MEAWVGRGHSSETDVHMSRLGVTTDSRDWGQDMPPGKKSRPAAMQAPPPGLPAAPMGHADSGPLTCPSLLPATPDRVRRQLGAFQVPTN